MMPREFVCEDCGTDVVSFYADAAANDNNNVCLTCLWLRNIGDFAEREALRKFLNRDRIDARLGRLDQEDEPS
jgi:hypothetical protein